MRRTQIAFALAITLTSIPASAAAFSYNFVACTHGTSTMLESGPELVAFGSEG